MTRFATDEQPKTTTRDIIEREPLRSLASDKFWKDSYSPSTLRVADASKSSGAGKLLPHFEVYDSQADKNNGTVSGHKSGRVEPPSNETNSNAAKSVYSKKSFTEISPDKKTGNTKYTQYDEKSQATDSVTRNVDGKLLTRTHNDPSTSTERIYTGKSFTETSIDKKTGNTKYTLYDDSINTTNSVTRDKNGNALTRAHEDPSGSTERNYRGKDYTEIARDKTTGNTTYTSYTDSSKTTESVVRDRDGKLIKKQ